MISRQDGDALAALRTAGGKGKMDTRAARRLRRHGYVDIKFILVGGESSVQLTHVGLAYLQGRIKAAETDGAALNERMDKVSDAIIQGRLKLRTELDQCGADARRLETALRLIDSLAEAALLLIEANGMDGGTDVG